MVQNITRRGFVGLGLAGVLGMLAGAGPAWSAKDAEAGRLKARPGKPTLAVQPGIQPLGLAEGKDGIFSVPKGYSPDKPVPLVIMLHGARGRTEGFNTFCEMANDAGLACVAPDSRGRTWDLVLGGYGPDIAFLDKALEHVFARVAVNPRRIAIAGFSDGASYALSVGLANGDLFTHVIPFSPGFMQSSNRKGKPSIWISHGTEDQILPFSTTRGRILPQLEELGYVVRFRKFEGGHEVTPDLVREAFGWFAK